jgi:hypothetical protein
MTDDLFVVAQLDEYRSICISTLARSTVHDANAVHLGGDRGYFIYEMDERPILGGIHILAKAVSFESALRLIELWKAQAMPRKARESIRA